MLIFNQNVLDLVTCFFLGVTYVAKLVDIELDGAAGYWLCKTLLSEGCSLGPFMGSMINLAAIAIERYLKVVHAVWSKRKLRRWMIKAAGVGHQIGMYDDQSGTYDDQSGGGVSLDRRNRDLRGCDVADHRRRGRCLLHAPFLE